MLRHRSSLLSFSINVVRLMCSRSAACRLLPCVRSSARRISVCSNRVTSSVELQALVGNGQILRPLQHS